MLPGGTLVVAEPSPHLVAVRLATLALHPRRVAGGVLLVLFLVALVGLRHHRQ